MRNEQEMMDIIMSTAENDGRIRAVIMNGSRTNPDAPRDVFQDYDIVYIVTDLKSFTADHRWIDRFGERMILQMPDLMGDSPQASDRQFAYLIQFMDGNRIDLTLESIDSLDSREEESLRKLLLDKDGLFAPFPPSDDRDYMPQPPTAHAYDDCTNEFWWVATYVAKGFWREELTYAHFHMDTIVRDELIKMLTWYVGIQTGYKKSVGKSGKYLKNYLEPELWTMFEKTYADADYDHAWDALFVMCDLFRQTAQKVAQHHGLTYPEDDDRRVSAYLRYIRELPADATDMDLP